jgi:hypothetical protein
MTSRFIVFLALVLVGLTAAPLRAQSRGQRRGDRPAVQFGWLFNLDDAKAEARKTGKPLMVVVRCVP